MTANRSHVLMLLCLAPAAAAWAQAQSDDGGASPQEPAPRALERVTISGRASLMQRFFASGSLVRVDRQDIEQMGADSVSDVLRQLPGVQVNTGASGNLEIRMRGMGPEGTRILVDGEPVSSRRGGQLPLDQLPADMIERIEVVRAPSAEFSGASGGTINIVLRHATAKRETNLRVTDQHVWGHNGLQAFFSRTGPLTEPQPAEDGEAQVPWVYFVAASASTRLAGSDTERHSSTRGQAAAESLAHEKARFRTTEYTVMPRLSGRLGSRDQVSVRAFLLSGEGRGDFTSAAAGSNSAGATTSRVAEHSESDRTLAQLRGEWTRRFSGSKLETTLSAQRSREDIERDRDRSFADAGGPRSSESLLLDARRERVYWLSSKLSGTEDALLWMAGGEYEDRDLEVNSVQTASPPPSSADLGVSTRLRRAVVWGQNEWALPASTTLTVGLRAERIATRSRYAGQQAEVTDTYWQPSLHTRTPIGTDLQWRFNLARLTRKPLLADLLDRRLPGQGDNSPNNPDVVGNPQLRPETTTTVDAGFERNLSQDGQLGLNLFLREVSDVVARRVTLDSGGRWVQQPVNVGDARVWGVEGDLRSGLSWLGLGREWSLSANASLLQSRMRSGDMRGERVPGQARYVVNLNVAKPLPPRGGWFGGASVTLNGAADLMTSPGTSGREASYASADAYVGRVVAGLGYWRVGVYNLTNSKRTRERVSTDAAGNTYADRSTMQLTPRLFITLGTRF